MSRSVRAQLICALCLFCVAPARAGTLTLDLPTAVARARERAPAAVAARARIAEAQGKRAGALTLTQNPQFQGGAGRRYDADHTRFLALDFQLTQPLDLGRGAPRRRVADAEIDRARGTNDAELRELSYEVATAFFDARAADLAVELAQHGDALARRGAEAAERRRKAGDITDLDLDLAKIAVGRAASALAAARAERADAIGRLGALIGAPPGDAIVLVGGLDAPVLSLASLRGGVAARADVRALDAEARVHRAELALADANARLDAGLWLGYVRDEGASIYLSGLTLTFPVFNRSQGERAVARAGLRRAELERGATVAAASRQVVDAFEAYVRAREAVDVFEHEALPALDDFEHLLERSLDAGQLAIRDYLAARTELLASRREHIDRRLRLARAAVTARYIAGVVL
ncbi:MAG: TolC family protein [Deltaproteobacteria bacterium]|nr:TolC family protein [Deltaproteobacteria bacterium]